MGFASACEADISVAGSDRINHRRFVMDKGIRKALPVRPKAL